jgi:hypothetical protein
VFAILSRKLDICIDGFWATYGLTGCSVQIEQSGRWPAVALKVADAMRRYETFWR